MSVDSATAARQKFHSEGGGSNPASTLHYHCGLNAEAEALVLTYHYSRRIPANVQEVFSAHEDGGLFGWRGPAVAAAFFSIPPTRWQEPVVELSRLVRCEEKRVQLSPFIAWCVRKMRCKGYDLLVSFADFTHGHHGGIYQACGWTFAGKRDRQMDGLVINGTFKPGRSCNSAFGTRSTERLRELFPAWHIEPHWDEGKYLYFKALNAGGIEKARSLGLTANPYPKPEASAA